MWAAFKRPEEKIYKFLVLVYALEFSYEIEIWNKFNSFINLVSHPLFAVVMLWCPFLRVCLGPLNSNIHPCLQ